MSDSRNALGWGVAFVVLGVVLVLRNAEIIRDDVAVWPWPVLGAGLALLFHSLLRPGRPLAVPIVLVVVGGVFALGETSPFGQDVPLLGVVLVALGAVLVANALTRRQGQVEVERASAPLEGTAGAKVTVSHGAGTLHVTGGAADGLAYEGTFAGGVRSDVRKTGDYLEVSLKHPSDPRRWFWMRSPFDWSLLLSAAIPIDLVVKTGASRVHIELEGVRLRSLTLESGAADVSIVLPSQGRYPVRIEAGAAKLSVRIPEGVAGSIVTDSGLARVEIDPHRFPRINGMHRSPDYETAEHRADIHLEGGVATFTVR
jgi:hypothetical protein